MLKKAFILLIFSSGAIIWFVYTGLPLFYFRQGLVALLAVILLLLICFAIPSINSKLKKGKWLLFVITQLFVQLLLVITGGVASPYLVLVHLTFIGMSFLFSFGVALLFLGFSIFLIGMQSVTEPASLQSLLENGEVLLLYGASFITIIPIAYILTQQYRTKDSITKVLTNQLKIEESILTDLNELVIVTDAAGRILSLNDAVERVLHKSRPELLQSPLFNVLLLKAADGTLLKDLSLLRQKRSQYFHDLSLLTSYGMAKVNMQIKPIDDLDGLSGQVSIIVSVINGEFKSIGTDYNILQIAMTKNEAMLQDLKNKLSERGQRDLKNKVVVIAKTGQDVRIVRELQETIQKKNTPVDLARLCKQTLLQESEYAQAFGVSLDFSYIDFGEKDIRPLIKGAFPVSLDQLTGPFFTTSCDIKYMGILFQKLLDIAILIVPKQKDKIVSLTIQRVGATEISINVVCENNMIKEVSVPMLFTSYYGELSNKTDLHFGSGLEGYIAQEISKQLGYPLEVKLMNEGKRIIFALRISKDERSLASLAIQQLQTSSIKK